MHSYLVTLIGFSRVNEPQFDNDSLEPSASIIFGLIKTNPSLVAIILNGIPALAPENPYGLVYPSRVVVALSLIYSQQASTNFLYSGLILKNLILTANNGRVNISRSSGYFM